mgnify:CR=1 FL=1
MRNHSLFAAALVLSSVACTITTTDGGSPSGSNTPATPDTPAEPGAGENGGGESGGGGGSGKTGTIVLTQMSFAAGPTTIDSYSASASFAQAVASGGGGSAACNTSQEGSCTITECTLPEQQGGGQNPAPQPTSSPHAGEITIGGAVEVKLAPDEKGAYTPKSGQEKLWSADADISVKAAGDTIPAFDQKVKAPAVVTLTAPEWPQVGQPLAVDRTKSIELAWTDGGAGDVTAQISTLAGNKTASVSCTFEAASGKGTIPAAALGKLLPTEQGSVSVGASGTTAFDAGDWKVSVMAMAPAKTAGGMASGAAKVE